MKLKKPYPVPQGSWIITKADGTLMETFDFKTAQKAESFGLKVESISEYLARFNKAVKDADRKKELATNNTN